VDLASRYATAVTAAGGSPQPSVISDLLGRWAEPHRSYHTLDHLAVTLDVADAWSAYADDIDLVRLALFYHDAIYDPRASDNEARSADLSTADLARCSVPRPARDEVHRLVRLTAGHTVDPSDRNGSLMADADLAVLAWDWPSYRAYATAIRAEYAHVPDDLFRAGRTHVLQGLLALPTLYRIEPLRTQWEAKARANLKRELADLSGSD
jgi:predicted metal-dependent HD superfamily phosphohydrolase